MDKDSPKDQKIAENSCASGSENLVLWEGKKHVIWEGFKKNYPCSSKNKLQHIQLSDTTGTSNRTGFYGQMKLNKNEIFSSKHSRWVW